MIFWNSLSDLRAAIVLCTKSIHLIIIHSVSCTHQAFILSLLIIQPFPSLILASSFPTLHLFLHPSTVHAFICPSILPPFVHSPTYFLSAFHLLIFYSPFIYLLLIHIPFHPSILLLFIHPFIIHLFIHHPFSHPPILSFSIYPSISHPLFIFLLFFHSSAVRF